MREQERGLVMKRSVLVIGVSLLVSFIYFGCGGGGDDEESPVANLQGTWLGVVEDSAGELKEIIITVDSSGAIVDVQFDGKPTGDTGHINEDWDENLFHVFYDDNPGNTNPLSRGWMIVDDSYRHATYADRNLYKGVLEKGAASFPSYAASDIVGNYPVGGAYEFEQEDPSDPSSSWNWGGEFISMTVNNNLAFSGNSQTDPFSGGFDAPLDLPNYGRYAGTLTRDVIPPITMDITALVSPDKTYVAAYAKDIGTNPMSLDNYLLIGLVK